MRTLTRIIALSTIVFLSVSILIALAGCKKESTPNYEITYTFTNANPSYTIQIWDITGKNDFTQSVTGTTFTKTITYDYDATYRCKIDNANGNASKMSISINYNGSTNICSDSLFSSLECFRNI